MYKSIHGHAVMEMILAADVPYSRQLLESAVSGRFGKNVRFHTCSARNLTLDELLSFLLDRGKVSEVDGCLQTARENICSHE